MILDIEKMMRPEEIAESGITNLSVPEQQAIFRWGLRMFGLGQHKLVISMKSHTMVES